MECLLYADDLVLGKSNTPPEQMRSLTLETININYPADNWLQVFTDGSFIENQANVSAGVYSELYSFNAVAGHNRSAFEGEKEAISRLAKNQKQWTVALFDIARRNSGQWHSPTYPAFQTSRFNELKARTTEKQWTVALSDIADYENRSRC
ncbi:unnamed protein product [Rodentolepis nana]|uniref:RNase H domain-containing protein n=1 Tax=Rodentolepis nana TaxID=102285 RepID=A0A0R3TTR4_RODNA|nr:unnamed protein product [Rodentolepis nana]